MWKSLNFLLLFYSIQLEATAQRLPVHPSRKEGPSGPTIKCPYSYSTPLKANMNIPKDHTAQSLNEINRRQFQHRPLHANGGGAYGYFEVTHDVIHLTKSSVCAKIGKITPVVVRFSTSSQDFGSTDTPLLPPEVRGLAVKFFAETGNWDVVISNTPTFPIRDPALFEEFALSRSRNKRSHRVDPNAWWNFTISHSQTLTNTIQLFSKFAYPDGWRHMDGFAAHAAQLVNAQGQAVYGRFQMKALDGPGKQMNFAQALNISSLNPDYCKQDLYDAIEAGQFPSWAFGVQVMTFEEARKSKVNPFDPTKMWPETLYPIVPLGRLVLNRNPKDYHSEIEVAAFSAGNLIPGLEPSPDPLLHARMSAYPIAQAQRLGPNYKNFPVNQLMGAPIGHSGIFEKGYELVPDIQWEGEQDDYSQAAEFYSTKLSGEEQLQLAQNIARWLKNADVEIQKRALHYFRFVSYKLVRDITEEMNSVDE